MHASRRLAIARGISAGEYWHGVVLPAQWSSVFSVSRLRVLGGIFRSLLAADAAEQAASEDETAPREGSCQFRLLTFQARRISPCHSTAPCDAPAIANHYAGFPCVSCSRSSLRRILPTLDFGRSLTRTIS